MLDSLTILSQLGAVNSCYWSLETTVSGMIQHQPMGTPAALWRMAVVAQYQRPTSTTDQLQSAGALGAPETPVLLMLFLCPSPCLSNPLLWR